MVLPAHFRLLFLMFYLKTSFHASKYTHLTNLSLGERRLRKAGSAVSVILECEARESHTPGVYNLHNTTGQQQTQS